MMQLWAAPVPTTTTNTNVPVSSLKDYLPQIYVNHICAYT